MAKIVGFVIVVLVVVVYFLGRSPNMKKYEYLKGPQIKTMANQKMLVVEVKGDPNIAAGIAFSQLFKTFYKIKGNVKEMVISAPRARWPKIVTTPKEEWVGIYGLAIPDSVEKLPEAGNTQKIEPKIVTWEYGTVAEILHIGPYNEEAPTTEKLMAFIKDKGYKVIDVHEEEYIKGPGMFLKGNPKGYYTIIRYRIKKK
ncbi:MAG: GyrI-like domain-containing protein [Elusimicrobia bacterium]|nr:GyrI-like domain-containing protein [Elusimicrobiota bacterium]